MLPIVDRRLAALALILVAILSAPTRAQTVGTVAPNQQISIADPEPDQPADAADAVADATAPADDAVDATDTTPAPEKLDATPDVEGDAETGNATVEPAAFVAPTHEQKTIGRPNSMFSARPADAVDEADAERPSFLSTIDPRTSAPARVVASLGLVIGLILLLRVFAKRLGGGALGGRPSGVVEILARYPVGRRQHVVIMKLGRRILVVHQNGELMSTLSEIVEPEEVASMLARIDAGSSARRPRRDASPDFSAVLAQQDGSGGQGGASLAYAGNEVVDLTRRPRLAGSRRATA